MTLTPIILKTNYVEPLLGIVRNTTTKAVTSYGIAGKYIYPNGYTDAAVTIGNPATGIKATGLEVIIEPFQTIGVTERTTVLHYRELIRIQLIQRSDNKLLEARNRFKLAGFSKYKDVYIPPNDIIQNFPAYHISFEFSEGAEYWF